MKRYQTVALAAAVILAIAGCEKKEQATHAAAQTTPQKEASAPVAKPAEKAPASTEAVEQKAAEAKAKAHEEVQKVQKEVTAHAEAAKAESQKAAQAVKTGGIDAKALYTKCAGCHGMKGEKHALGKSNILQGQSADAIAEKIRGYQNGSYGGAMKGLMSGQVKNLSEEQIVALSDYISKL